LYVLWLLEITRKFQILQVNLIEIFGMRVVICGYSDMRVVLCGYSGMRVVLCGYCGMRVVLCGYSSFAPPTRALKLA
jgi:hypothetical protein